MTAGVEIVGDGSFISRDGSLDVDIFIRVLAVAVPCVLGRGNGRDGGGGLREVEKGGRLGERLEGDMRRGMTLTWRKMRRIWRGVEARRWT